MAFTDQNRDCRDCNQEFVFTAGEQEFYESRGLVNAPSRCPSCRAARKGQSNNYSGNRRGDFRDREPRHMYTTTCAICVNQPQMPFLPPENRPMLSINL